MGTREGLHNLVKANLFISTWEMRDNVPLNSLPITCKEKL